MTLRRLERVVDIRVVLVIEQPVNQTVLLSITVRAFIPIITAPFPSNTGSVLSYISQTENTRPLIAIQRARAKFDKREVEKV